MEFLESLLKMQTTLVAFFKTTNKFDNSLNRWILNRFKSSAFSFDNFPYGKEKYLNQSRCFSQKLPYSKIIFKLQCVIHSTHVNLILYNTYLQGEIFGFFWMTPKTSEGPKTTKSPKFPNF